MSQSVLRLCGRRKTAFGFPDWFGGFKMETRRVLKAKVKAVSYYGGWESFAKIKGNYCIALPRLTLNLLQNEGDEVKKRLTGYISGM